MQRYIIMIIWLLISIPVVFAQTEPKDIDTQTHQRILQEHATTRKFFSEELTRQRNQIFNDFDERAEYYEKKFDDTLMLTAWKLGFLWAGTTIFIVGFLNMLRIKLERRKYTKLKKNLLDEVNVLYRQLHQPAPQPTPQPPPQPTPEVSSVPPPPPPMYNHPQQQYYMPDMGAPPPKKSYWQKRKDAKKHKELEILEKKRKALLNDLNLTDLAGSMGGQRGI